MSTPSITSLKDNASSRKNWISWLALGATHTVEDAEAYTLRKSAEMDETNLATVKTPIPGLDVCHLRTEWQKRQIELNTVIAQKHIDRLLIWLLAYDGKERIMENLKNAINTAMHKREMKVNIVSFDYKDTVALDDESYYEIDWIIMKTNFLQQLQDCFGDNFKIRRTSAFNKVTVSFTVTLTLEFWP